MSSKYNLEFSNQAKKFLKGIRNKEILNDFASAFEFLSLNPYAGKFLQANLKGYHSYRVHSIYRIIYKIFSHKLLIFIADISHRKDSYR
mgnify:CR=1 FL=1